MGKVAWMFLPFEYLKLKNKPYMSGDESQAKVEPVASILPALLGKDAKKS